MRERMRAIVRDGCYVTPHPLRKRRRPGTRSRPINACHGFRAREISARKKGVAPQKADVTVISVASVCPMNFADEISSLRESWHALIKRVAISRAVPLSKRETANSIDEITGVEI